MITLATLPQATAQEVLDQVATHLLTQNHKCVNEEGNCQYRAGRSMCAAGCLIANDEYDAYRMEDRGWVTLNRNGVVPSFHSSLIDKLQTIHDSIDVEEWALCIECLAMSQELETPTIVLERLKKEGRIE